MAGRRHSITRREFLAAAGAASLAAAAGDLLAKGGKQAVVATMSAPKDAPNILVVMCDQLSQRAVGAYGDAQKATPNIDAIAAAGVRFSKSYVQCPLCMPLRASLWTGRYPHETGVMSNYGPGCGKVPSDMPTLGAIFTAGGYETACFGKTHDGGALRGFSHVEKEDETPADGLDPLYEGGHPAARDRCAADKCVEFLGKPHDKPFLAVASMLNPHGICGWIGENKGPHKDAPIQGELPPLPDNFEIEDLKDRPIPIQYLCCSHRRLAQASHWSPENYRYYLAAYYRYVKMADAEVGRILKALRESPAGRNTLVVFHADHGDGMACHRMVTKETQFYDETTRVPLIFAGPGVSGTSALVEAPLASMLDLVPTLCEYARLAPPKDARGKSLMPFLRGEDPKDFRQFLVSEWYTEAGFAGVVTPGRMVRSQRYKYTRYVEGNGEELFDLEKDPGEKRTLVKDPACADVLAQHRKMLESHVREINDPFFTMQARRGHKLHALGYPNHG